MARRSDYGSIHDEIISIYSEEVDRTIEDVTQIVDKAAKNACEKLHNCGVGSAKYQQGWQIKKEYGYTGTSNILHNLSPQLPHLFEFGTADRFFNGKSPKTKKRKTNRRYIYPKGVGRMPATPHIRPIADAAEQEIMENISKK